MNELLIAALGLISALVLSVFIIVLAIYFFMRLILPARKVEFTKTISIASRYGIVSAIVFVFSLVVKPSTNTNIIPEATQSLESQIQPQQNTDSINLEDAIKSNGSDVAPEPTPANVVTETTKPKATEIKKPVQKPKPKPKSTIQKQSAQEALRKKLLHGRTLPNFAYLIYKDYFGCQNRETTHTLVKIATQGDSEAMNKVLTEGFLSGDCIAFAPGDIVFITDHGGFLSGTVKIRRQGETESYWTITEATMGK